MKILIYGEYSGYGKSMAMGFRKLGHDAAVFSPNGDGWKKIDSDLGLLSTNKFKKINELLRLIPVFLTYDLIYIMNPSFFNFRFIGPLVLLLFKIKKIKVNLLCCGDDVEYIKSGEAGIIEKYVFSNTNYPKKKYFKKYEDKLINYLCAKISKKIIPTMYDYEQPWKFSRFSDKVTEVVPLACYIDQAPEIKPTNLASIKILHGINRKSVKGTDVILSALGRIAQEFDNVIVYTPEKLSQSEYLKIFSEIDISIDQCKCHSYGMNAIYSMLHGHVVLAPADEQHCKSFKIDSTPIISISNHENDIYEKIKYVLTLSSNEIDAIKIATQDYAVKQHLYLNVCQRLLNVSLS